MSSSPKKVLEALKHAIETQTPIDKSITFKSHAMRIRIKDFSRPIFFTFDYLSLPYRDIRDFDKRKAFAVSFLKKTGYNYCAFMLADVLSWYRDPEWIELMELIREVDPFQKLPARFIYGSSMGGYAGAAHARNLRADVALLVHPISTLKKELVPWEKRYLRAQSTLNWNSGFYDTDIPSNTKVYVLYDNLFTDDSRHARRIQQSANNVELIKVPGFGHEIVRPLMDMDLFQSLFYAIFENKWDQYRFEFYKLLRARKRNLKSYYVRFLNPLSRQYNQQQRLVIIWHYTSFLEKEFSGAPNEVLMHLSKIKNFPLRLIKSRLSSGQNDFLPSQKKQWLQWKPGLLSKLK